MKFQKIAIAFAAITLMGMVSCKKLLDENQRTAVSPQFFTTSVGVVGGITGVYGTLRNLWGTQGFTIDLTCGTDETVAGSGVTNPAPFTYLNAATLQADFQYLFQVGYQDINTLNGVLLYGTAISDPTQRVQYLAQAKFLRAFLYYNLVMTFGDVPLHTTYITDATASDTRAKTTDVYTQIITDLTQASTELPVINTPTATTFGGRTASQATALYLLGKAYLSRGWYNSVAHPTTPNGAISANPTQAAADFAQAATILSNLITNKATYGVDLWQDYGDAFKPGNDYGKETLFVVDESSDVKYGNFDTNGSMSGGAYNSLNWFFRPNYPLVTGNYPATGGATLMTRDIPNGRPFIRIKPNTPYLTRVFADHTNDSRYDKSFQVAWIANTAGASTPRGALTVAVDTAIWMPLTDPGVAKRASFKGVILLPEATVAANAAGGQASPGNPYTTTEYPSNKKFDDPNRTNINDESTRPVIVYRFADAYLLAAEAYFKAGDNNSAANMINLLRTRAAFRTTNTAAQNTAAVAASQITAAQITLDFILDERSRELYEEGTRWQDLARTQSLGNRIHAYNTEASQGFTDNYALRPIPANEIQLITQGPPFPQNPGY
jgi:hypothetical protein